MTHRGDDDDRGTDGSGVGGHRRHRFRQHHTAGTAASGDLDYARVSCRVSARVPVRTFMCTRSSHCTKKYIS